MKKIIALPIVIMILLMASCSGEKTAEQINEEITQTRGEIARLNEEIEELENQLASIETGDKEDGTLVVAEPLQKGTFSSYISTSASVEAAKAAMISPEMNARIQTIHVREGQKVQNGQLLVSLDSDIMDKGIEEVEKGLELAKILFDKQEDLWKQGVGSEMQYLETKNRYESLLKTKATLESQMKMSKIYAPFAGYVEEIFQKTGEMATPARQILELVNLENLFINTQLSEAYINSIQQGDTVLIEFPDVPGISKRAPISNTGNTIDPQSRTFSVRLTMKNREEQIKPNMLAELKLRDYYAEDVIIVPTQLVRQDLQGHFVYLARPHDNDYLAVKTYIQTGRSDGRQTVVEKGLEAGDLLVVKGYNQIKDGSRLNLSQK